MRTLVADPTGFPVPAPVAVAVVDFLLPGLPAEAAYRSVPEGVPVLDYAAVFRVPGSALALVARPVRPFPVVCSACFGLDPVVRVYCYYWADSGPFCRICVHDRVLYWCPVLYP